MKNILRTLSLATIMALLPSTSSAKNPNNLRVYINPGHGAWTDNDRPFPVIREENGAIVVHNPAASTATPDTTAFFETNTNLRKCFGIVDKLEEYGLIIDRTKNQTNSNAARRGAALDLSNNICMSHVKAGAYGNPSTTTNAIGGGKYNRPLTEIADEADINNFDMFISVHSNGEDSGYSDNYLLFLYRGTDATESVSGSKAMISKAQPYMYAHGHNYWTTANSTQGSVRGDHTFYGTSKVWNHPNPYNGRVYSGYLGVMMHGVPGYLAEGYFHTYQPARHRAMNFDTDRIEGYQYARGIADYFGLSKETTGDIYGLVRDWVNTFTHTYYHPNTSTDDKYLPINNCTVTLRQDGNIVRTYTTDNNFNGAFVFSDLPVGNYTIDFEKDGYVASTGNMVSVTAAKTVYPEYFLVPETAHASLDKTTIYITGEQFSGIALDAASNTPYQSYNCTTMNYDDETDCYYFTFEAGSDNSFSMSTQCGTYSAWDANGIVIDKTLYQLTQAGSGKPFDFDLDTKYILCHDSKGEGGRSPLNLVAGEIYTLYLKGDFKADRAGGSDTDFKDYLWVSAGTFDADQARTKLYIEGAVVGTESYWTSSEARVKATDLSYSLEQAKEMIYDAENQCYYYDFYTTSASQNYFSVSRFAPARNDAAANYVATNGYSGFWRNKDFHYGLWEKNGVLIPLESTVTIGGVSRYAYINNRYATINDEAARRLAYSDGSAIKPYTPYRIKVGADFNWMEINELPSGSLYVMGAITGSGLNQSTDYKKSNAREFSQLGDGTYYYEFEAVNGDNSFSLSTQVAETNDYQLWNNNGLRTDNMDQTNYNVITGIRYPLLSEGTGTRYVTTNTDNPEAYGLTPGNTYTMYVKKTGGASGQDKWSIWVLPGTHREGTEETLYLVGAMNRAQYDLTSEVTGAAPMDVPMAMMIHDPVTGDYTYRAKTNLYKHFAMFNAPVCQENYLISCENHRLNDVLEADMTKYELVMDSDKGKQRLNNANTYTDVTIHVCGVSDLIPGAGWQNSDTYGYLYIRNNSVAAPLYAEVEGINTQMTFTSGTYELPLSDSPAANMLIRFSRYGNSANDVTAAQNEIGNDGNGAFNSGLIWFEKSEIAIGETVNFYREDGRLKSPALAPSASTPSTTLTLGRHFNAALTVSYDETAQTGSVTLHGESQSLLYLSGSATHTTTSNPLVFTFNDETRRYELTVKGLSSDNRTTNGPSNNPYFSISTQKGANWANGALTVSGMGEDDALKVNTKYPLIHQGSSYYQKVEDYNNLTTYTYYVDEDLSEVWVHPDVYTIGWLSGGYGYDTPPGEEGSHFFKLDYDEEKGLYTYQTAGSDYGVFELSTAWGNIKTYNAKDDKYEGNGVYSGWVDGMLYFKHGDEIQPELKTLNAFVKDTTDPATYGESNYHYPAQKGDFLPNGTRINGDMTIEAYNPNYIYTVYLTKGLDYMWVSEQPVNMPLKAEDFHNGNDEVGYAIQKPHYFLVGTRTADWRLLPEWGLKVNADRTEASLSGRFMYDGYFAFAKVDNYYDYLFHRYEKFSNSLTEQQDYSSVDDPIVLKSVGDASALHYTDDEEIPDIHTAITWNLDPDYFNPDQHGFTNADMMKFTVPWRIESLTLNLADAYSDSKLSPFSEHPTLATFTGTKDPDVINQNRTFSLVGSDINYEQPYDFGGKTGVQSLRDMGPTAQKADQYNWANCWISYDEDGIPYYDAFLNTLYLTAYDLDWIDHHDVHFDMKVGDKFLEYNSENLFFTPLEKLDTTNDPYAWLYTKHSLTDGMKIGENVIEGSGLNGEQYKYLEKLVTSYEDVTEPDYQQWDLDEEETYKGWKCYVIKDVWLKGNFKAWSGWGGNLWSTEGWDDGTDPTNVRQRWYFGNFGHTEDETNYPVSGHDVLTYDDDPENNCKVLYQTSRDVDRAYFQVEGSNDTDNDDVNPQYFQRIILWYNVNEGDKEHREPNGVLQLIQESLSPNIQAQHVDVNHLYATWNIVDRTPDDHLHDWNVVEYTISRYHIVSDASGNEVNQLYRKFDPVDISDQNVKVIDLIEGSIRFDDPYALPRGTYYYTVDVTIESPETGEQRSKSATSNILKVNSLSLPVTANAEQIIEDNKYSMNVKLTTKFAEDNTILKLTSHYTYAVFEDAAHIVITVDKPTALALNGADKIELLPDNPGKSFIINSSNAPIIKPYINWDKTDDIGFTIVNGKKIKEIADLSDCGADLKFKPNNDADETYCITFDLNQKYYNTDKKRYMQYFADVDGFKAYLATPTIIWHNVKPTEGITDATDQYTFEAMLTPDTEVATEAKWRSELALRPDKTSTGVYVPATQVVLKDLRLVKSDIAVNHSSITNIGAMPPGSIYGLNGVTNPVHYEQVNEIAATLEIGGVEVTDEVIDKLNMRVNLRVPGIGEFEFDGRSEASRGSILSVPLTVRANHDAGESMSYYSEPVTDYNYRPTVAVEFANADNSVSFSTTRRNMPAAKLSIELPEVTFTPNLHIHKYIDASNIHARVAAGFTIADNSAELTRSANTPSLDNLYFYPGFHIQSPDDSRDHRSAHGGQPIEIDEDTRFPDQPISGYTNWTSGDYDDSIHNWSRLAAKNRYLAVRIDPILTLDYDPEDAYFERHEDIDAELYVIYPVVTSQLRLTIEGSAPTPARQQAPAKAPAMAQFDDVIPLGKAYNVPLKISESISNITTGVETVVIDETDYEPVYYNLQGIRIENPAPGQAVIEVRGSQVVKRVMK